MDKTIRSILWMLVILVLFSSFSAGWFFISKEKIYSEYVELHRLFEANMKKLNTELASSTKDNKELKAGLEEVKKELDILESDHLQLKSQNNDLIEQKESLTKELAKLEQEKTSFEKKIKAIESDEFVAGLLRDKISLEVKLKRLFADLTPKGLEIEELQKKNMALGIEISKLEKEKKGLEEKMEDADNVAEVLSRDLLKERDKDFIEKQEYEKLKGESQFLKTRLSEYGNISDRFNMLLTEKTNMEIKLSNLEKDLNAKNKELESFKLAFQENIKGQGELRAEAYHTPSEVELPPIVLRRNYPSQDIINSVQDESSLDRINEVGTKKGRLIAVNREHRFVIIDLGRDNGVEVGTRFDIYRETQLIGSIDVIQVRQRISACDIKSEEVGTLIQVDDVLVKR